MAASRGGEVEVTEIVAAGPTDLKRYLPLSLAVTGLVAGLPLWVAFGLGARLGVTAMLASIALSFVLAQVGNYLWQRHPGSRDVVFNDLMLWGFIRRTISQRRLMRHMGRLGLDATDDPDSLTLEERTELIKKLAVALETGDPYTHGHSQRVARHAFMTAKYMKLSRHSAEKIRLAGVIHDVGKLRTPREIITKPGKLTDAEFEIIQRHTVDGAEMVKVLGDDEITDMVLHHHERLDGTGYPDKLSEDDISIGARILAVADTFDAASSLRPYRAAQKHKVALDILEKEAAAGRLDTHVVQAFLRYYSGRRAWKWWAMVSTSPAQLHDIPMMFLQRIGTASVANMAVVGVTAMALTAGSPLHGGFTSDDKNERRGKSVAEQREEDDGSALSSIADGSSSPGSATASERRATAERKARRDADGKDGKDRNEGKGRPENAGEPGGGKDKEDKGPKGKPEDTGPPEGKGKPDDKGKTSDDDDLVADTDEVVEEEPAAVVDEPVKNEDEGPSDEDDGGIIDTVTDTVPDVPDVPVVDAPGGGKGKDK